MASSRSQRLSYPAERAGIWRREREFFRAELQDLKASVKTVSTLGDFSTIGFAMTGLGEVTYGIGVSFRLISFCNSD